MYDIIQLRSEHRKKKRLKLNNKSFNNENFTKKNRKKYGQNVQKRNEYLKF